MFLGRYLDLLNYLSIMEYNSQKCNKIIIKYSKLNGLNKKKYKKIKIRL